jgi:hypothetical protein
MDRQQEYLWSLIEPRKRSNPIKRAELLARYNDWKKFYGGVITDRELRAMKEELIMKEGKLIGSSEQGYYVMETIKDFEESLAYYRAKAIPLLKIRSKLKRSYHQQKLQYQLI